MKILKEKERFLKILKISFTYVKKKLTEKEMKAHPIKY
jgi:hypothetical protein